MASGSAYSIDGSESSRRFATAYASILLSGPLHKLRLRQIGVSTGVEQCGGDLDERDAGFIHSYLSLDLVAVKTVDAAVAFPYIELVAVQTCN
jgi:hypothetical protein